MEASALSPGSAVVALDRLVPGLAGQLAERTDSNPTSRHGPQALFPAMLSRRFIHVHVPSLLLVKPKGDKASVSIEWQIIFSKHGCNDICHPAIILLQRDPAILPSSGNSLSPALACHQQRAKVMSVTSEAHFKRQ